MFLRKLNYRLRRLRTSAAALADSRKSLNDLDAHLSRFLDFTGGFFLEVGANDGVSQSNTFYLEKCFGWRGILIEAIPDVYERCVANRPACQVVNKAVVAAGHPSRTVRLRYANLMSLVEGAMEESDEHIRRGLECQGITESYVVEVPAATLSEVLRQCRPHPPLDFLSLDVEGYELEVLRGVEDGDWPAWLLVETSKFEAVKSLLEPRYRFVEKLTVHDYLFRRR